MATKLSILALIIAVGALVVGFSHKDALGGNLGAVGVKLIENYSPYVKYNGGINSALPIQTSSTIKASSATFTATTGCIQLYATSTATAIKEVFVTTGATSTYNGTVYWSYGSC